MKRILSLWNVGLLALWAMPALAGDGTPVTSMSTIRAPAVASGPYNIGGYTINYGVGDNVRITGVNVGATTLQRSSISKPNITINRIDNAVVTGDRLTLFYPGQVSGTTVNIEGDEAPSMEQAMNDDYVTSGGLDVFLNQDNGVEKANNIERVDFVVPAGINLPDTAALLSEIGTVANEKHGNNTYKIAMITSLDSFGKPSGYGLLKTIQGNVDYGNVGRPQNSSATLLRNLYMRNGENPVGGGGNGPTAYIRGDTNFIGLSFISFAALGASTGQTVYGYSLFPNDMFDSNDLVGLTDAPTNTSGGANGGDIYGGTFAVFATSAAETETSEGSASLTAEKTVTMYDPLNEGLFAIPGNDVLYEINVGNTGTASPDAGTVKLMDKLPSEVTFYHADMDDSGPETNPVIFVDNSSGLGLNYATDVRFSNSAIAPADFLSCGYNPASGYDPAVTYICVRPTGTMNHGTPDPNFSIKFRAKIN